MATQFFGAFNDNVFQIAVALLLIKWVADPSKQNHLITTSGVLFTIPFLMFSLLAGRVADRYSKSRVVVITKAFDILIVFFAVAGMYLKSVPVVLLGLTLLALQSAFFGPAKYGILPEILPESELSKANGFLNVASFAAILGGTIVGTAANYHLLLVAGIMVIIALASLGSALLLEPLTSANPQQSLAWNPIPDIWNNWKLIEGNKPVKLSLIASAYFWFLGGILHLNMLTYVNHVLQKADGISGLLLIALVIGIAVGSLLAGRMSHQQVETGFVPLGALGIGLFMMDFYFARNNVWRVGLDALFLGVSAGLYTVPLNTLIQARSPKEDRGRILATGSFLSFVALALSMGALRVLGSTFKLAPDQIFLVLGVASLFIAFGIILYLPQTLIRLGVYLLTNIVYRLEVRGRENVPIQGGALLVANHVSMADPFLISGALSRLVRFLMYRGIYDLPLVHPLVRVIDAIPVDENDSPKEIMRSLLTARRKLEEGHLVCIFAEGQISRLGGSLLGFRRGLEIITKGIDVPVIPIHLEGVWGSIFSFERGKFYWKWPKHFPCPVTLSFGKPLKKTTAGEIRQAIMDLGAEDFSFHRRHSLGLFQSFLKRAKAFPNQQTALDSSGQRMTALQLLEAASLFVEELEKLTAGIKPGDRTGVLLPPSVAAVVANIGLASKGIVPVNLNYTLSPELLSQICGKAGINHVISTEKMISKCPTGVTVTSFESVMEKISEKRRQRRCRMLRWIPSTMLSRYFFSKASRNLDDLATIMFTSGSTGVPKGVLLTQRNILSNIQALQMVLPTSASDTILGILPFFHSFGYTGTLWFPLLSGFGAAYHSNPLDVKTIGDLSQKSRVTLLIGTPTFLSAYLRRIPKDQFSSLRLAIAGAERLSTELNNAWTEKFGAPIMEGYGCTELSPVVAFNVQNVVDGALVQHGQRSGKVGRPLPGISIRVVDPVDGRLMPSGQTGLLQVKGPNVMRGYLDEPQKTADVIKEGWYSTGDLAAIDDDGFLEIKDRISRFSKIGGEMVPHVLIEDKCHHYAGATERRFVVVGVPDEKRGEALAVLVSGNNLDISSLWSHLNESELPKLWLPAKSHFIHVDELPLLGTGKVDLSRAKEIVLSELSKSTSPTVKGA